MSQSTLLRLILSHKQSYGSKLTASTRLANASPKKYPTTWKIYAPLVDLTVSVTSLLSTALKPVTHSLDSIKETIVSHANAIKTIETTLITYSDKVTELESAYCQLLSKNDMLTAKLGDLENRSRRSNLRVIRVLKKMEDLDPVRFMTSFFLVHSGGKSSPKPRSLIICFQTTRIKNLSKAVRGADFP